MSFSEQSSCHKAHIFYTTRQVRIDQGRSIERRFPHCVECQQECDVEEICDTCGGTGTLAVDVSDGEGNIMRGVGSMRCPDCQSDPEPYEDS